MILQEQGGQTVYSDSSEIEKKMLSLAKEYPGEKAGEQIAGSFDYTTNNTFSPVRENLLNWYPFEEDSCVLEIGAGMGALTPLLSRRCKRVVSVEMNALRAEVIRERMKNAQNVEVLVGDINTLSLPEKFDYVVFVGVLEYAAVFQTSGSNPFLAFLTRAASFLKEDGKLLFAIENQYGLKYWCGAAEDHLQEPFAGIAGYKTPDTARTFSKATLARLLEQTGLVHQQFYYVYPDYKFPTFIFSDGWKTNGSDFRNIAFTYGKNSALVADERDLYEDLAENGVLGFFANSFLVESSRRKLSQDHPVLITARSEVKPRYRVDTVIDTENTLTKIAAHPQAEEHLKDIWNNEHCLQERGVHVLTSEFTSAGLARPIYDGARADQVLADLLNERDLKAALELIGQLRCALLQSSPVSEKSENYFTRHGLTEAGSNLGTILQDGFVDMTFYNAFLIDGELAFFDQEWKLSDVPLDFILYYAVKSVFARNTIHQPEMAELVYRQLRIDADRRAVFDRAEDCIWKDVFLRQGDLYGEGGYCTQYHNTRKLSEHLAELDILPELRQELRNKTGHIELLLESERTLNRQMEEKDAAYKQMAAEKDAAYAQMAAEKDAAYAQMAAEKDAAYKRMAAEKDAAYKQMAAEKDAAYKRMAAEKDATYKQMAAEKDAANQQLQQTIRNKEGHIQLLLESDRELERIKSSRSWRFMGYAWKLRDTLIPKGSKRRLFGKMLVKFIKHPIRVLRKCTPHKISKFFRTLRREGVEMTSRRLDDCLIGTEIQKQELRIEAVPEAPAKTAADYAHLEVPQWTDPQVSIVIPVYNQFEYTYLCIKSIVENSGDISYEILIADDCSTDLTQQLDKIISGVKVIRNQENLRFLRNCNHAAQFAKGRYILFLNNDTQVQKDWLAPLVELIERDEKNGMVGSKLVYPDGRLQEAGGILWKDGSAWNYGNRSDPDAPEYNYVKEVDYISGAAIMIRRTLWEEIGGFDERFAPAYCEDSDLAFEVRKHGCRVLYQPLSVVVHFEGVSNGTDTSSGQKAYQVINQKKFFEKWKDVLEKEHFENGYKPFVARERGQGKKFLLMVDHYVPQFDKDAGSRTVFQYIQLFVRQGYHVKFIGDNFFPHQPYTQVLQQMGVEVLYGPYYANHWKEWLQENGQDIGYAFLNRPHIAVNYIDEVRQYTPARIIYYGHDLHFLRERREYELTGDPALLCSSEEWKKKELALMRKADWAYYPSSVEEQEIHAIAPDVQVKAIPAYLFSDVEDRNFQANKRKDLMFIGGFGHRPNVDAVKWLAEEIMPHLVQLLPDVTVHILGSNPPEDVKRLESPHLKIEGFVTDAQLEEFYANCRLDIVPLRYGAGIKGKVVEAMRYGMPVVTTSVGAEGIDGAEEILAVEDDAKAFAERVAQLYGDERELAKRCKASLEYVRMHFSPENAAEVIGPEFDMK